MFYQKNGKWKAGSQTVPSAPLSPTSTELRSFTCQTAVTSPKISCSVLLHIRINYLLPQIRTLIKGFYFFARISKVFLTFLLTYIHQKFHQNNGKENAVPIPRISCSVLLQIRLFYLVQGSYLSIKYLYKNLQSIFGHFYLLTCTKNFIRIMEKEMLLQSLE